MNLPTEKKIEAKHSESKHIVHRSSKAPIVLSIIALCLGVASALFSGYLYMTQPQQINNYVQAHKEELKGDKGDTGAQGLRGTAGRNGVNSYSPTYCSTYNSNYSSYSSTSCY